jgi:hypothetical protein
MCNFLSAADLLLKIFQEKLESPISPNGRI